MATRKSKSKQSQVEELALRRWCIEQAIRWPLVGSPYQGAQAGVYGIQPLPQSEANIIDRANRLLAWVTKSA